MRLSATRIVRFSAVLFTLAALWAPPALAADPDDVARTVFDQGYFIEPGASISAGRAGELVAEVRNEGERFSLVVLSEEPAGGAVTFADAVFDRLGLDGTVLVVAPETAGFSSDQSLFTDAERNAALERAFDVGGDDESFAAAFVATLVGEPASAPGGSDGGGGSGFLVFLVVIAVIGLLGFLWVRSQRKRSEAKVVGHLEEAKAEIQNQVDAVANEVLDLEERVRVADNEEADAFYQQANAAYVAAAEAFERATDLRALESISDQLDEAAWQLDAAEAVLEGRPVPKKPPKEEPGRCFFDPTHAPPYVDAEIRTPAGSRTVKVCRADAEKLQRGERPDSRMIEVGGRRVPAASAPRSHGGLGMGGLDMFSVILGGMASQMSWGGAGRGRSSRPRASSRSGGGLFPRPSGRGRSSSRGRSSGSSRRRSASRSGRSRGGGRRRR